MSPTIQERAAQVDHLLGNLGHHQLGLAGRRIIADALTDLARDKDAEIAQRDKRIDFLEKFTPKTNLGLLEVIVSLQEQLASRTPTPEKAGGEDTGTKLAERIVWLATAGEERNGVPYEITPGDWIRLWKQAELVLSSTSEGPTPSSPAPMNEAEHFRFIAAGAAMLGAQTIEPDPVIQKLATKALFAEFHDIPPAPAPASETGDEVDEAKVEVRVHGGFMSVVDIDFARKLLTERDEARKERDATKLVINDLREFGATLQDWFPELHMAEQFPIERARFIARQLKQTQSERDRLAAELAQAHSARDGYEETIRMIIEALEWDGVEGIPTVIKQLLSELTQVQKELTYTQETMAKNDACFMEQNGKYLNMLEQRDTVLASLHQLYRKTRNENRDFAKNAQEQRDDWQKEATALRTNLKDTMRVIAHIYCHGRGRELYPPTPEWPDDEGMWALTERLFNTIPIE